MHPLQACTPGIAAYDKNDKNFGWNRVQNTEKDIRDWFIIFSKEIKKTAED